MRVSFKQAITLALFTGVLAAAPAGASSLVGSLKDQASQALGSQAKSGSSTATSGTASGLGSLGGAGALGSALGLPSIGGSTASNAAGVLQYCLKNKYLGGTDAAGVKDKLLGKVGLGTEQAQKKDTGYQQGLGGILSGSDGSSFSLDKIKGDVKEKACDYVLENASSLL